MRRKVRIGWDISHMEFTIEDHYYYSKLKYEIKKTGAIVKEIYDFKDINKFDILVINYPEYEFNRKDIELAKKFMDDGGKIIVAGYYRNEDNVADKVNSLSSNFGLEIKKDNVKDKVNCFNKDELFVVTSDIIYYRERVNKVMFPCAASIKIKNKNACTIICRKEIENNSKRQIIAAETGFGKGKFILIGTCVFWDNFTISKYNNLRFSINLLLN